MGMNPKTQKRKSKGRPDGGQFAPETHETTPNDLDETPFDQPEDGLSLAELAEQQKPATNYSFLPGWGQAEKDFEQRLGDMPARFYTTDLVEKTTKISTPKLLGEYGSVSKYVDAIAESSPLEKRLLYNRWGSGRMVGALSTAASLPQDAKNITRENVTETAKNLGLENLRFEQTGGQEVLIGQYGGHTFMFQPEPKGEQFATYRFTRPYAIVPGATLTKKYGGVKNVDELCQRLEADGYEITKVHPPRVVAERVVSGGNEHVELSLHWNPDGTAIVLGSGRRPVLISGRFSKASFRCLIGAERIRRATGKNPLDLVATNPGEENVDDYASLLDETLKAQSFGERIRDQQKYVSETKTSLASAWEDKKYPDQTHRELAENSILLQAGFRKVEVDNDVAPKEFHDFEQAVLEAQKKLPKIPAGTTPAVRVRKLGKHKALGLYVPHVNTICVDVHDSGSFVHEYGHMLDFQSTESSMGEDFAEVIGGYRKALTLDGSAARSASYYRVPTEIWARAFELWGRERLGIDNRTVHPKETYESRFDYRPFQEDPELKERAFRVFDRLAGEDSTV
ncbi:hypothetical protein [Mobiluncus curtisii]|uniref:hypothetical protein n=1 Tax=Mobiluncus curtisii TaxID=2051 RepID=UPI001470782A|nr:hypothetical protein [Mobiluncus curtisii]NMW48994.1 hypothetical protein [Mobiluncus curtisii]